MCFIKEFVFSCSLEARGGRGGGRNRRGRHHDNPIKHLLYPSFTRYDKSLKPTTDNADQQLDVTVNMFVRELGPLNLDELVSFVSFDGFPDYVVLYLFSPIGFK